MTSAKRIITILGTLFCALGTGFFMQHFMQGPAVDDQVRVASASGATAITPVISDADVPTDVIELDSTAIASAVPVPPSSAPQPERLPDEPVTLAALDDEPIEQFPVEEPTPSFACEMTLNANPAAAALVELVLDAPCQGNDYFTVHHSGMMFTQATDAEGKSTMMVPALSENAVFIVTFPNGDSTAASAEVSSVEYYDRAVVQWAGDADLQIHALENGADYDSDGHVWNGAAREMAAAARGEGGFLMRLGNSDVPNAHIAEVYTYPSAIVLEAGEISLSVEAEVSEANCARDIEAQTLQKSGTNQMQARDLVLSMPDCDAIGDFLVLNNLLDDLKIARN